MTKLFNKNYAIENHSFHFSPSTIFVLYSKFYHINWYKSLVKGLPMNTRNKPMSNSNQMNEALAKHEVSIHKVNTNFENVNATLQAVISELQTLRVLNQPPHQYVEVNPFYHGESSNSGINSDSSNLKLYFPKFDGNKPYG